MFVKKQSFYEYFFPNAQNTRKQLKSKNQAASRIQALFKGIKTRKKFLTILNKIKTLKKESMDIKLSLKKNKLSTQDTKRLKNKLAINKFLIVYYKNNKKEIMEYCKKDHLNKSIVKVKKKGGVIKISAKKFCSKKLKTYNSQTLKKLRDQTDYIANLTGLYYTDYNTEKYREQYSEFYFNLLDPIVDYVTKEKRLYNRQEDSNNLIMKLFKKFLQRRKEFCTMKTNFVKIRDYMHSNASVEIENRYNFDNELASCIKTGKKLISGFILLDDKLEEDHALHANTFIIALEELKIFRLEPNFAFEFLNQQVINKFYQDGLKYGKYPLLGYYDYTNQALYSYFKKNPLFVNIGDQEVLIEFGGYYSSGVNSNPYHGGLCMFISSLQTHLKRTVTVRDVRKYSIAFFRHYYTLMFGKDFGELGNLKSLFTFIKHEYSTPETVLKVNKQIIKDYSDFNEVFKKASVKNIKIEQNPELTKFTFVKPTDQDLKEIY